MPQNALLPQGFLPLESIRLARFLVDLNHPLLAQHDPDIEINPKDDTLISQHLSFSGEDQAGSGRSFGAALPSLISSSVSNTVNVTTAVSAASVTSYQLINSGTLFRKAVRNQSTRLWIEEQHDAGMSDVFFITGFYTMHDASVTLGASESKGTSQSIALPISAALASGGIVLPLGGITDPEVSASFEKSKSSKVQFVAPGERVCALQYRKVVYRWFSSRNIDKATLERDNRWHTVNALRDLEEGEEEDDVLEVDLEDDGDDYSGLDR